MYDTASWKLSRHEFHSFKVACRKQHQWNFMLTRPSWLLILLNLLGCLNTIWRKAPYIKWPPLTLSLLSSSYSSVNRVKFLRLLSVLRKRGLNANTPWLPRSLSHYVSRRAGATRVQVLKGGWCRAVRSGAAGEAIAAPFFLSTIPNFDLVLYSSIHCIEQDNYSYQYARAIIMHMHFTALYISGWCWFSKSVVVNLSYSFFVFARPSWPFQSSKLPRGQVRLTTFTYEC